MISIIIIVKNNEGIRNTLKKLEKISKPEKTEVLVIDASEEDSHSIDREFPLIRWIYFYNKKHKKITIPEQRNIGIKKARGDIIVFIDSDCIPDNNWLVELVKPILNEKEFVVSGLIKTLGKKSIWDFREEAEDSRKYVDEVLPVNMAFKKEIIEKVGFLDEEFNYGSDMDFAWRIIEKDYKIRRNNNAVVYHKWGDLKEGIKRAFRYGEGRAKLYKKHPYKWKNLFITDQVTLFYPLYIIFFPITFILILIPIIKNIKRQPLKVVFTNLIYGFGVLKELFFSKK